MTLTQQRAAGRPGPCRTCRGRRSCRSAVARNCPAFLAWTALPWEVRVREEYRALAAEEGHGIMLSTLQPEEACAAQIRREVDGLV